MEASLIEWIKKKIEYKCLMIKQRNWITQSKKMINLKNMNYRKSESKNYGLRSRRGVMG